MNGSDPLMDEIIQRKIELRDLFLEHYKGHELFSATWWLCVALLIIPLVIWWKFVDRRRLLEISVFGLLANLIASFLDVAGSEYALWEYPVHTLPQISLLIPVDYVIVPVIGMFLYQKFTSWKAFILACTIASVVMAFVCEPLAVRLGIYDLVTWRYVYSFPIYVALYVVARLVTGILVSHHNPSNDLNDRR